MGTPNQYHLTGGGISVSYFPGGSGPVTSTGRVGLTFQNAIHHLTFHTEEVQTVEVSGLASIVTVALVRTIDTGSTTFSLLVPNVNLPEPTDRASINTEGITTVLRFSIIPLGTEQTETYGVTALTGTASAGPLPL